MIELEKKVRRTPLCSAAPLHPSRACRWVRVVVGLGFRVGFDWLRDWNHRWVIGHFFRWGFDGFDGVPYVTVV
jgi:hypothetical protein